MSDGWRSKEKGWPVTGVALKLVTAVPPRVLSSKCTITIEDAGVLSETGVIWEPKTGACNFVS